MKKIGIITLTGNKNYGNKLQNYAMEKIVKKYGGYDVYTIWITNGLIKECLKKIKRQVLFFKTEYIREHNFKKFTDKYLNVLYINKKRKEKLDDICNGFVIGSDQIWNPNVVKSSMGIEILKSKNKKISYSASLGVSNVDNTFKSYLNKYFKKNNIEYISVREEEGKKIIEETTNRKDISVLIDPTMLIDTKEWEDIATKPTQKIEKKYILNYFLGNLEKDKMDAIEKIANENDCEIINILDKNSSFYKCDPTNFLYLEKNAFLICTDSFHSSVFAFLFNRPFVIFKRDDSKENMYSRLENLIKCFNLKNRTYNGKSITKENLKNDYKKSYEILERERKKSEQYLIESLKIFKS